MTSVLKELTKSRVIPPQHFGGTLEIKNDENDDEKKREIKNSIIDEHIADLLVLPPKTELHAHKLVESGHIILQVKAHP